MPYPWFMASLALFSDATGCHVFSVFLMVDLCAQASAPFWDKRGAARPQLLFFILHAGHAFPESL